MFYTEGSKSPVKRLEYRPHQNMKAGRLHYWNSYTWTLGFTPVLLNRPRSKPWLWSGLVAQTEKGLANKEVRWRKGPRRVCKSEGLISLIINPLFELLKYCFTFGWRSWHGHALLHHSAIILHCCILMRSLFPAINKTPVMLSGFISRKLERLKPRYFIIGNRMFFIILHIKFQTRTPWGQERCLTFWALRACVWVLNLITK